VFSLRVPSTWPGSIDNYVDALVWLVGELLTDPKHFFRSSTVKELGRLITARPTEPVVRAHEVGIYKRGPTGPPVVAPGKRRFRW
jgi:hypothetical protein